jgi:hypothetical protein
MVLTIAANPAFGITEEDAGRIVGRDPKPRTWPELVKLARTAGITEDDLKDLLKEQFGEFNQKDISKYADFVKKAADERAE